jgi:alkylresorcinol/alkylpyrone synthase
MQDPQPSIVSVATAVPPHKLQQTEIKEETRKVFADLPDIDRLIRLFDRAGIEERYFAFPKSYYLEPRGFGPRNHDYIRAARDLGESAIRPALDLAEVALEDVDLFIFTTTTGLATPSLDAMLAEQMGMRADVRRMPLFGLGCAGGAGALSMAADYLRARPKGVALVLSVELCSLTWSLEETTKTTLVGLALFADGAGCAVLTGGNRARSGAQVLDTRTELFPETADLMGWDFSERGFGLVLSPNVPGFIAEALPSRVQAFLEGNGLRSADVDHFALHPGGRQVLEAYRRGLGLSREALEPTREALRRNGNLSSASVFFSLDEVWRTRKPKPGEKGFMAAMGPGFAAEMLLLEWR